MEYYILCNSVIIKNNILTICLKISNNPMASVKLTG